MKILFQYQTKSPFEDKWVVNELIHECDSNKSDRENLDDAFTEACNRGANPNKLVKWLFFN